MNSEFSPLGRDDKQLMRFSKGMQGIKSRVMCACWTMIQSEYAYKKNQIRMRECSECATIAQ
jgi:hypothetical protein